MSASVGGKLYLCFAQLKRQNSEETGQVTNTDPWVFHLKTT
jgi:hypothetical protein